MSKYCALALVTKYWKPGEDYLLETLRALEGKVHDGDFVAISEKAISTALGRIVDESIVESGSNARFITDFWMRIAWGYLLGVVCHFGHRLILRLRNYPIEMGKRHKQVSLQYAGLMQALMFGSEGGIDGSNLPYSYVCLPLADADRIAHRIWYTIRQSLRREITLLIIDTDKTYSFRNFHFTPRPKPLRGICALGGICAYLAGRFFKLKKRSTPIAVAGRRLQVETALKISNMADKARGPGSGATVWDMASRFGVGFTEVSWDMLEKLEHKPIVIVRKIAG